MSHSSPSALGHEVEVEEYTLKVLPFSKHFLRGLYDKTILVFSGWSGVDRVRTAIKPVIHCY